MINPIISTQIVAEMGRTRKDCPLCPAKGLLKLTNHLANVHDLTTPSERKRWTKYETQTGSGGMKRSSEDTFSDYSEDSHSDGDSDGENSSSDHNSSDDSDATENDPWYHLVCEVHDSHGAEMMARRREIEKEENLSKKDAHKQMHKEFLPTLTQTFREKYVNFLKKARSLNKDMTHRQIKDTAGRLRDDDQMDWEESIEEAARKRKLLLARELKKWTLGSGGDSNSEEKDNGEDRTVYTPSTAWK